MKKRSLLLIIVVFQLLIAFCIVEAAEFGQDSAILTNTYMPRKVGDRFVLAHYELMGRRDFNYEDAVKIEIIDGVACLRINSVSTFNAWFSSVWLAQDTFGNVYALQFYDTEHNNTPIVLGKANAVLFMPATVKIGDKVLNETVIEIGVSVDQLSTGFGPYTNCIKTIEDDGDVVYYAPGVGEVKKVGVDIARSWELKEVIHGDLGCATFIANTLHVPCLDLGAKYWLDLTLKGTDPITLELTGFGEK